MYILMSISCVKCDKCFVRLFSTKPTERDRRDIEKETGGMLCIRTFIVEVGVDEAAKEVDLGL